MSMSMPMPLSIPDTHPFICKQLAQSGASELTLKDVFLQIHSSIPPPYELIMPVALL